MMKFLIFAGFNSKFRANNAEILPSISTSEYRRSFEAEKLDAIVPSSLSLTFTTCGYGKVPFATSWPPNSTNTGNNHKNNYKNIIFEIQILQRSIKVETNAQ